ncbi:MAG: serine/threonine protein kinase, partial [Steroidobacter sp.]
MTLKYLVAASALAVGLAGCSSGDVELGVATTDNSVDNSTGGGGGNGGGENPCASYTVSGALRQGSFDGANCTYSATFVGA